MSIMYVILAVAGWVWLAVVALVLVPVWIRNRRQRRQGLEVAKRHEKQC